MGVKTIHVFPSDETIVAMIKHKELIVIATTNSIYSFDGYTVEEIEVNEAQNPKELLDIYNIKNKDEQENDNSKDNI